MDLKELPDVAKSVYLDCKKCETQRYFVVIAHKTSTSAKVECEVCKAKKTFKLEDKKSATKKKVTRKRKPSDADIWQTMKTQWDNGSAKTYTIRSTFAEGDVLDHSKFGVGFVTQIFPNKIEVLFEDSRKELVHSRQ